MLHDNLITENFLHHVQKEQSLSPPPSNSSTKMNLYNSFHYKQMQHQLLHNQHQQQEQQKFHQLPDNEVLDLSRRCNSVETQLRKTSTPSSPYHHHHSAISPIENHRKSSSVSPIQRPEISASLLAENLQKFYNNQQTLLPKSSLLNGLLNTNQSQPIASIYPIYYPQIKQEITESSSNSTMPTIINQKESSAQPTTNILQIPQPNEHLLKNTSSSQYEKSSNFTIIHSNNISPKSNLKTDITTDIDRFSDASSIPGSPSSSTSIIYPKLLNTTNGNFPNTNSDLNSISNNKTTRPFKAFPRDPLVIAANFAATDVLYDNPRVERYTEYRKRVLEQIRSANGGERTISNPKMRRLNTRNNYNGNNTNVSSDGSYSDSQANNSEIEDRANDSSSDNDTTVQSTTNFNCNNNESEFKTKDLNRNNNDNENNSINTNGILKDAAYYERRRKNNAAAKKSRDRRRIKEDEIAIRAAYLERQNIELLCQLDSLKAQLAAFTKIQKL